jgi:hypothetical protein
LGCFRCFACYINNLSALFGLRFESNMNTQLCEDGVMGICVGLVTCDPAGPSLVLDGDPFFPKGCFHGFFIIIIRIDRLLHLKCCFQSCSV